MSTLNIFDDKTKLCYKISTCKNLQEHWDSIMVANRLLDWKIKVSNGSFIVSIVFDKVNCNSFRVEFTKGLDGELRYIFIYDVYEKQFPINFDDSSDFEKTLNKVREMLV